MTDQLDVRELPVDWTLLGVVALASLLIGLSIATLFMRLRRSNSGSGGGGVRSAIRSSDSQSLLSRLVARSDAPLDNPHQL